jgi:hypothetical protein
VCAGSLASYFITVVKCTLLDSKTLNCCSSNVNLIQWHFLAVGCIAVGRWLGATGLLDNLGKKLLLKIQWFACLVSGYKTKIRWLPFFFYTIVSQWGLREFMLTEWILMLSFPLKIFSSLVFIWYAQIISYVQGPRSVSVMPISNHYLGMCLFAVTLCEYQHTHLQIRHTAFPLAIIHFFVLERLTLDFWILRLHSGFAVPCLLALTHTHTQKTLT